MDRKLFTIIMALALVGCFFLPFFKFGGFGSTSAFDIVFKSKGGDWEKYIWLLIPLSGVLLLIGAANNENYMISRALWSWLPLLTVIYIIVRLYMSAKQPGVKIPIGDFIKVFDMGFWATFAVSLVLAVVQPKSKYK